jgi:molybdopterin converting factor small subunit
MRIEKIKLRVFGVLRNFSDENGFLEVVFPQPVDVSTCGELKEQLIRHSGLGADVLSECALADEEEVLMAGSVLKSSRNLALLPPVCGG